MVDYPLSVLLSGILIKLSTQRFFVIKKLYFQKLCEKELLTVMNTEICPKCINLENYEAHLTVFTFFFVSKVAGKKTSEKQVWWIKPVISLFR